MKFKVDFPTIELKSGQKSTLKGRLVFVHWDRKSLSYLVVQKNRQALRVTSLDQVERDADRPPLSQLGELLNQDRVNASQVVVLLSRANLQMANITLPPSGEDEVPELVRSQVEEQLGDSEQPPVIDYVLGQFSEASGGEALAFALDDAEWSNLQDQAKESGMKLMAVVPRSLASWGLLAGAASRSRPLSIAVTRFESEVELMILKHGVPRTVRTIRTRTEDIHILSEQVALEIQRCLAVEESSDIKEAMHLFVFGDRDTLSPLVEVLVKQFEGPVAVLNPFDSFEVEPSIDKELSHQFAALSGAALSAYAEKVPVNLTAPKKPPKPPSPLRRWAFMGGAIGAAILAVVYTLAGEISDLQVEYEDKKKRFETNANMARKRQEKADDVSVAERWLRDEVNWLEQLKQISETLPSGQEVTVRRLSASTGSGASVFDLGVQVSQPEKVAELENRLRGFASSVASKRVSEQTSDEEYPWQFEPRIVIPISSRELSQPDSKDDGSAETDTSPVDDENSDAENLSAEENEEALEDQQTQNEGETS